MRTPPSKSLTFEPRNGQLFEPVLPTHPPLSACPQDPPSKFLLLLQSWEIAQQLNRAAALRALRDVRAVGTVPRRA